MAERTIKHGLFTYWVPVPSIGADGEETTRLTEQMAFQGQTVDIPREDDIAKGEQYGAFYTEEELKLVGGARGEVPPPDAESEEEVELADLDDSELVEWIQGTGQFDGNKPSAEEVVAAGKDDPELAVRLLEAENTAQGDKGARKTVVAGLEKVTEDATQ